MNNVSIVGNLTREVQYFKTQSGISYARFTVAVTHKTKDNEETAFIPCMAWRGQADFLNQYSQKGDKVSLIGRITTGSYDDKTTGKKVYTVDVTVVTVELIGKVQKREKEDQNDEPEFNTGSPIEIDPDDLPF